MRSRPGRAAAEWAAIRVSLYVGPAALQVASKDLVATEDRAIARYTVSGTATGGFRGHQATGRGLFTSGGTCSDSATVGS